MAEEAQVSDAPVEATEAVADPSAEAVDDANDLRGFHFKRLMRKRLTWILIAIGVIAAGAACGILIGPIFAAVGGAAVMLLAVLIVFGIADSKAESAFFELYAQQRGMTLAGKGPLPAATPLLRKGDDRYAERTLSGPLSDGVDGTLALYTYEEESTDSEGNRQTNYYRYTVGLCEVPECVSFVPELFCRRKFGFRALEKVEDAFRSTERVRFESEKLQDRYEIFSGKQQDANWLRQLFSPTFIVWLSDTAPEKFAFELVNGTLVCYVNGHKKSAAELNVMCDATSTVAKRLREEALE